MDYRDMTQVEQSDYLAFLRWREEKKGGGGAGGSVGSNGVSAAPTVAGGKGKDDVEMVALAPAPAQNDHHQRADKDKKSALHAPFLAEGKQSFSESLAALDEEASKDSKFLKLSEGRLAEPVNFAWRNVTMRVPIKTGGIALGLFARKTGEFKNILTNVSGYICPGQVLYIMGPSGAGKSSMLDCLSDRVAAEVTGVQWLSGQAKTPFALKEASKYVQQQDDLLGAMTVKETLECAAAFYVSDATKRAPLVEAVIEMLGLVNQTDVKVGDIFFRGLSGGQKRRVSIGIELIAQPQMLFLDEPTSGLDSASAFSIMKSIRKYAIATKTPVLCTIHQPSELLFELGDNLLLLSGGKQVYFGPISQLENHFNALGFHCPPRTSLAEWMLDLVNRDFGEDAVVDKCIADWNTSQLKRDLDAKLEKMGAPMEHQPPEEEFLNPLPYKTSQVDATWALFLRGFRNAMRAPQVIWLRFAMYFMLSILIGTIWLQLGTSAKVINDFNGCMFYTTAFMIFMSISVLPAYLEERNVFIRERANASYSVQSYLIAHFLFELPFLFLLSLVCSSTIYWLVGFWAEPNKFFIYVANLFLGFMVAESIMVLISAAVPYFIVGIAIGAFTFGAFMCVMGYFIAFPQIGWWWRWMRYIAVHYYNFSTFMTNQYAGNTYTAFCPVPGQFPCYPDNVNGTSIVTYYDLEQRIWLNMLVQLLMVFGYRFFAWLYMTMKIRGKK